jgi:NADH-ubiquinone oxidoreductase chain 1
MIKRLLIFIGILLGVAFLTLLERKILGYVHLRKGPNLVGIFGLMQPMRDGVKIVTKQTVMTNFRKINIILAPTIFFFLRLFIWISILQEGSVAFTNRFLFLLFVSRIGALIILLTGWGGGRTFSFLGGIRASAQIISYEVILSFLLSLRFLFFYNLRFFDLEEKIILDRWVSLIGILRLIMLVVLAETNRAPFDLTEGESELVRGFNTEFSSTLFVLLFLGEYRFILFFSVTLSLIFFNRFKGWLLLTWFFV